MDVMIESEFLWQLLHTLPMTVVGSFRFFLLLSNSLLTWQQSCTAMSTEAFTLFNQESSQIYSDVAPWWWLEVLFI